MPTPGLLLVARRLKGESELDTTIPSLGPLGTQWQASSGTSREGT